MFEKFLAIKKGEKSSQRYSLSIYKNKDSLMEATKKRSTLNYNNGIGLVKAEKQHPARDVLIVNQLKLLAD